MDIIRILQLGNENWGKKYTLPEIVELQYADSFEEASKEGYDIVFLDRAPSEKEIKLLHQVTKAYTLFATEQVKLGGGAYWLYECKKGKRIAASDIQDFLLHEARNYYPKPYGEKYDQKNLAVSQDFTGRVRWNGNYNVCLGGDFGEEFCQIAYWRNNIPVYQGECIELWLEYKKDPEITIALTVTQFKWGSVSDIIQKWRFSESDLEQVIQIDNQFSDSVIFISLLAKGKGELQIIALHDRHSRRGHGFFLPGGERYVTSEREEVFFYFDPGDRKPPLNVYFSGYKTREGFEGYNMMRRLGCPFLLVAEARLEGGCFYMGSCEYETLLGNALINYMKELDFTPEQVILSGISMGTFGALYYGCDIKPHSIILGKPLASLGTIAANEKLLRPGGFPTSLDMLWYLCGNTDEEAIKVLDRRFWDKFESAEWEKTKLIISYMIEDDYDPSAYSMLISHIHSDHVQLYGKGIHGRHNDNTGAIIEWFIHQFERVLEEDFSRKVEK